MKNKFLKNDENTSFTANRKMRHLFRYVSQQPPFPIYVVMKNWNILPDICIG